MRTLLADPTKATPSLATYTHPYQDQPTQHVLPLHPSLSPPFTPPPALTCPPPPTPNPSTTPPVLPPLPYLTWTSFLTSSSTSERVSLDMLRPSSS
jgi:hypothetical protein